jgi:hypothetical protein
MQRNQPGMITGGVPSRSAQIPVSRRRPLTMRRAAALCIVGLVGIAVGATYLIYLIYARDLQAIRSAVAAGSQVMQTPRGPVEYAMWGDGPTMLVVHATDDGINAVMFGQYTADHIPGARFLPLPTGGHLLLGHQAEVRTQASSFLREHAG